MARPNGSSEYRSARQASGLLLVALVVAVVLLDAFRPDFDVNPLILVPILLTAGALFSVDVQLRPALPDYSDRLTAELRALARARGLADGGTRDDLIARLAAADAPERPAERESA